MTLSSAPKASTAHAPASTRVPPELLEVIFKLARPPVPLVTIKRVPVSDRAKAFTRLALVHRSWTAPAQRVLAASVVLRSRAQMRKLRAALEAGQVVGPVQEIVLDLKELPKSDGSATVPRRRLEDDDDSDQEEDELPPRARAHADQSFEPDLVALLEKCGADLKILRCRGFGDECFVSLPDNLLSPLSRLDSFEYSPVDTGSPPRSVGALLRLGRLPGLKHLSLRPSSRTVAPVPSGIEAEPALTEQLLILDRSTPSEQQIRLDKARDMFQLVWDLQAALQQSQTATATATATDAAEGLPIATLPFRGLESVSLASLALTPCSLALLLTPTFETLTSLSLISVLICGPSSATTLILALFVQHLVVFELHEHPAQDLYATTVSRALNLTGGPAAARVSIGLSHDHFWELARRLKRVRTLKLYSPHVFSSATDCLPKKLFRLPRTLRELSIGSAGKTVEQERAGIDWWLDRIEELHAMESESLKEKGKEKEDSATNARQVPPLRPRDAPAASAAATAQAASSGALAGLSSGSPTIAGGTQSSTLPGPQMTAASAEDPTEPSDEATAPDDEDDGASESGESEASDWTCISSDVPSEASAAQAAIVDTGGAAKSEAAPKAPETASSPVSDLPAPRLEALTITTNATRRQIRSGRPGMAGAVLSERLDELGEAGTRVYWWGMRLVMLDELDMTRELRIDMTELPSGWVDGESEA